jgi:hypothetical protein
VTTLGYARIAGRVVLTIAIVFPALAFGPIIFPTVGRELAVVLVLGATLVFVMLMALFVRWLRLRRNPELQLPAILGT